MISLDFPFKVTIFFQFQLKNHFEVTISSDFLFKVTVLANFDLKVDLK